MSTQYDIRPATTPSHHTPRHQRRSGYRVAVVTIGSIIAAALVAMAAVGLTHHTTHTATPAAPAAAAAAPAATGRKGVVGGERHGLGPFRQPALDGCGEVVGEALQAPCELGCVGRELVERDIGRDRRDQADRRGEQGLGD